MENSTAETSPSTISPAGWHPSVDEYGDGFVVFGTPSRVVRFTEPFAAFLAEATTRGVRPVLVTAVHAQVSPFVSLAMRQVGGVWAVQRPDCSTFDALSGFQIESFDELWSPALTGDRLPGYFDPPSAPAHVLTFDVHTQQRASDTARVGLVAEEIASVFGITWKSLGIWEPFLEAWDISVATAAAKATMPESRTLRLSGSEGAFGQVQVARTKVGLLEHTVGGVVLPEGTDLASAAVAMLKQIGERFNPTVGMASFTEYDYGGLSGAEVVQSARGRHVESPAAILIGPGAVRDLKISIDELKQECEVQTVGRARMPSFLVQFTEGDLAAWGQAARLLTALGSDNISRAMGVS